MPMTSVLLAAATLILANAGTASMPAVPGAVSDRHVAVSFQLADGGLPKADGFVTQIIGKWERKVGTNTEIVELTKTELIMSDKDITEGIHLPLAVVEETDSSMVCKPTGETVTIRLEGETMTVVGTDGVKQVYTRK